MTEAVLVVLGTNIATHILTVWQMRRSLINSKLYPYFQAFGFGALKNISIQAEVDEKYAERFSADCARCGLGQPRWEDV